MTGATGFLGQRLVARLLAQGWQVCALTHRRPLPEKFQNGGVASVAASESEKIREAISECGVLFHLAAYIPPSLGDWKQAAACFQANAQFTLELAELEVECGSPRMVYFSSAQGYRYSSSAVTEEAAVFPSSRATYYLASKLLGEIYLEHARLLRDLPAITLRVGSCYGSGMPENSVVSRFMSRAGQGLPLEVWDGGIPTCDYVYADDVIDLAVAAVAKKQTGIFNAGTGKASSLLELAETVKTIFREKNILIEVKPQGQTVPASFPPLSVAKAFEALGYRPKSLSEGLAAYRLEMEETP